MSGSVTYVVARFYTVCGARSVLWLVSHNQTCSHANGKDQTASQA